MTKSNKLIYILSILFLTTANWLYAREVQIKKFNNSLEIKAVASYEDICFSCEQS